MEAILNREQYVISHGMLLFYMKTDLNAYLPSTVCKKSVLHHLNDVQFQSVVPQP